MKICKSLPKSLEMLDVPKADAAERILYPRFMAYSIYFVFVIRVTIPVFK